MKQETINGFYIPLEWMGDRLKILDQTLLPGREVYLETTDYQEVAGAIKELKLRGAPAIGVAAAYGIALGALVIKTESKSLFIEELQTVIKTIAGTRPTAKNLFKAVDRMKSSINPETSIEQIKSALIAEAKKIHQWEIDATEKIGRLGAELIPDRATVLTHCNAGPLATTGYGTALGIIIRAKNDGKDVKVITCETRPLLQGARLTTCELKKAGVPFKLITDSMSGHFIKHGDVTCVIVGADRIAANGDTANKIGTYTHAVLAKEHGVPFYVAAPTTTIDSSIATGDGIVIEERKAEEITQIQGIRITPEGTGVYNPAFDVTPHKYIKAIITEKGVIREPYQQGIGGLKT
ncbi:S-methyl-5-thioribose-1-phosphate isomerase [Chloroflexota bacterium]